MPAKKNSLKSELKRALRFEGMDEIISNISNVIDRTNGKEVKEVYLKAGMTLRNKARDNAPVVTGKLRESIFAARGDQGKSNVLVGVNYKIAPHAHLVEYGTVKTEKHPYLRPAITESASEMRNIIVSGLQRIIEDASGGH